MAYNNPTPEQSTTLSTDERSREARKILNLLREESDEVLEGKLTPSALEFVRRKWVEMDLGDGSGPIVSASQLFWLRDLWQKFA